MREFVHVNWSHEPDGNVAHMAEHGVTPGEFEQVLTRYFEDRERSRSSDCWVVEGLTDAGRYLVIVFEWEEDIDLINPVTAYEPDKE